MTVGKTETEFQQAMTRRRSLSCGDLEKFIAGAMPAEVAAKAIVRAAERPQREIFLPLRTRLFTLAAGVAPSAVDWLLLTFRKLPPVPEEPSQNS